MNREREAVRSLEGATLRLSASFFRAALRIYTESRHVEDGGRLVGFVEQPLQGPWTDILRRVRVEGLIPSGPGALRTPISLHQDGEWQEEVFRRVERAIPDLEHFGSFHHHCSFGHMPFLSHGDVEGYRGTLADPRYRHPFYLAALLHTPASELWIPGEGWGEFFNFFLITAEDVWVLDPTMTALECHNDGAVAAAIEAAAARPVGAHRRQSGRDALAALVRAMAEQGMRYSAVLIGDNVEIRLDQGPRIRMLSADEFDLFSRDGIRTDAAVSLARTLEYLAHQGAS